MPPPSLAHADRLAGTLIEGAMGAHHRRRLRHLGHARRYDPPADGRLWAAGDPPPRDGCRMDVLVDGEEALPAIAEALRGLHARWQAGQLDGTPLSEEWRERLSRRARTEELADFQIERMGVLGGEVMVGRANADMLEAAHA